MAPGNTVDDGEALRTNIVSSVGAYLHPTSTVPMGADSDSTAVVDAWGRVRGVEALRVVDASILPDIPSVATNVTTIMVAERIAAKLSKEWLPSSARRRADRNTSVAIRVLRQSLSMP